MLLGDIVIERLTCARSISASQINVCAGGRVGKVTLADFEVRNQESVTARPGSPKRPTGKYPDAKSSGVMPAFGLFARDVDGLVLRGEMRFRDEAGSGREATVFEGVTGLEDGRAARSFHCIYRY